MLAQELLAHDEVSSHTINRLNSFRKSTPPQNRQLIVLISNSKLSVFDFVGKSTF